MDFVKADDMLGPYFTSEIAAYQDAIGKSGRDMVLSLSPGRVLSLAHLDTSVPTPRCGASRTTSGTNGTTSRPSSRGWRAGRRTSPGAWADADMLPVGRIAHRAERGPERLTRLTPDEQRTMMTLWCMARSPLMLGCDLPHSDPGTLDLLTNPEVLEVLQHWRGNPEVLRDGDLVVWTARPTSGAPGRYVAVFNIGDEPLSVRLPLASAGCVGATGATDLWTGAPVPLTGEHLQTQLAPHAAWLLRASG